MESCGVDSVIQGPDINRAASEHEDHTILLELDGCVETSMLIYELQAIWLELSPENCSHPLDTDLLCKAKVGNTLLLGSAGSVFSVNAQKKTVPLKDCGNTFLNDVQC
jgi:hypothetical protein